MCCLLHAKLARAWDGFHLTFENFWNICCMYTFRTRLQSMHTNYNFCTLGQISKWLDFNDEARSYPTVSGRLPGMKYLATFPFYSFALRDGCWSRVSVSPCHLQFRLSVLWDVPVRYRHWEHIAMWPQGRKQVEMCRSKQTTHSPSCNAHEAPKNEREK